MITNDSQTDVLVCSPRSPAAKRGRGRPRGFDREEALDAAMRLFWERGYEGTSIRDLTKVMGLTSPSLYQTFGGKAPLFAEAVERYAASHASFWKYLDGAESTALMAVGRWLVAAATMFTDPSHPNGCMIVSAAVNSSAGSAEIFDLLFCRRKEIALRLERKIQAGVDSGELRIDTDVRQLAWFYATVYQGMSRQAQDGAPIGSLMATVQNSLRAWPSS